jgi:hypothetical protein
MILVRMIVATRATTKTAVLVVDAGVAMMTTVAEVEGTMTADMVAAVAIMTVEDTAVAVITIVVDATMTGGTNLQPSSLNSPKMRHSRDF